MAMFWMQQGVIWPSARGGFCPCFVPELIYLTLNTVSFHLSACVLRLRMSRATRTLVFVPIPQCHWSTYTPVSLINLQIDWLLRMDWRDALWRTLLSGIRRSYWVSQNSKRQKSNYHAFNRVAAPRIATFVYSRQWSMRGDPETSQRKTHVRIT